MGVLESSMIEFKALKPKLDELKINPEALKPQSVRDAGKRAGEIVAELSKPSLISQMNISGLLNPDTSVSPPNVSPDSAVQSQPGPMSGPNDDSAVRAKAAKEAAKAAKEAAKDRAFTTWCALNEERPGYNLKNGVVEVPISPEVTFYIPYTREVNTSPSSMNVSKNVYDFLMDHKEHCKQQGVTKTQVELPSLHPNTNRWLNDFISYERKDVRVQTRAAYGIYNSDKLRSDLYMFLKNAGVQGLRKPK
jgi:hypothetical protein